MERIDYTKEDTELKRAARPVLWSIGWRSVREFLYAMLRAAMLNPKKFAKDKFEDAK
jgi:hypothetical protein